MMVNANLMLLVVMLWAGTLPVASPKHYPYMPKTFWEKSGCDKYILPMHTMWIPRASCGDNKRYSCQAGYISHVQTSCKNGDWLLEPTCQASSIECPPGVNINNSDDVTESRLVGEDFNFTCSVDTRFINRLICGENGIWTDQNRTACPRMIIPETSINVTEEIVSSTNCQEACDNDTMCADHVSAGPGICSLLKKPLIKLDIEITSIFQCIQKCKDDSTCLTIAYFNPAGCATFSRKFSELSSIPEGSSTIVEKSAF